MSGDSIDKKATTKLKFDLYERGWKIDKDGWFFRKLTKEELISKADFFGHDNRGDRNDGMGWVSKSRVYTRTIQVCRKFDKYKN